MYGGLEEARQPDCLGAGLPVAGLAHFSMAGHVRWPREGGAAGLPRCGAAGSGFWGPMLSVSSADPAKISTSVAWVDTVSAMRITFREALCNSCAAGLWCRGDQGADQQQLPAGLHAHRPLHRAVRPPEVLGASLAVRIRAQLPVVPSSTFCCCCCRFCCCFCSNCRAAWCTGGNAVPMLVLFDRSGRCGMAARMRPRASGSRRWTMPTCSSWVSKRSLAFKDRRSQWSS